MWWRDVYENRKYCEFRRSVIGVASARYPGNGLGSFRISLFLPRSLPEKNQIATHRDVIIARQARRNPDAMRNHFFPVGPVPVTTKVKTLGVRSPAILAVKAWAPADATAFPLSSAI